MGVRTRPDTPSEWTSSRAWYTILTDFDGTITLADTIEAVFARFAPTYCRQRGIQYTPFATFADIIAALMPGSAPLAVL